MTRLATFDAEVLSEGRRGEARVRQTAEAVKVERTSGGATEAVFALKMRSLFFKNRTGGCGFVRVSAGISIPGI